MKDENSPPKKKKIKKKKKSTNPPHSDFKKKREKKIKSKEDLEKKKEKKSKKKNNDNMNTDFDETENDMIYDSGCENNNFNLKELKENTKNIENAVEKVNVFKYNQNLQDCEENTSMIINDIFSINKEIEKYCKVNQKNLRRLSKKFNKNVV